MTGIIILGILAAIPVVLTLMLRSNGAMVFLALCEGSIVDKALGNDAITTLKAFFPRAGSISESTLHIVLLLLPALLTVLFLRKQMAGARMILNIAPAILTGATVVLFILPLLPGGIRADIMNTTAWTNISKFEGVIVGAGALISLLLIWTSHKGTAYHKKGKH